MKIKLLIALFCLGALFLFSLGCFQVMAPSGGVTEATAKNTWRSSSPFAMVDWVKNGSSLTVVLKNNTYETINFVSINIGSAVNADFDANIASGDQRTKVITDLEPCAVGTRFSLPKETIKITYSTEPMSVNRTQMALADIVGTCS